MHHTLWSGAAIATPSYKTYARFHGRTAEEQVALDEAAWEQQGKADFSTWNARMREVFHSVSPLAFKKMQLIDQYAYDAWLTSLPWSNGVFPRVEMDAVEAYLGTALAFETREGVVVHRAMI